MKPAAPVTKYTSPDALAHDFTNARVEILLAVMLKALSGSDFSISSPYDAPIAADRAHVVTHITNPISKMRECRPSRRINDMQFFPVLSNFRIYAESNAKFARW